MKRDLFFNQYVLQLLFTCCIIFTLVMAFIPNSEIPDAFNLWDKAQHALAFAVLTITGSLAYPKLTKAVYVGLIVYGAAIEVFQSTLTTTRFGEVSDLLADSVGVAIGFAAYLVMRKVIKKYR